jgi:hypothetical protein
MFSLWSSRKGYPDIHNSHTAMNSQFSATFSIVESEGFSLFTKVTLLFSAI